MRCPPLGAPEAGSLSCRGFHVGSGSGAAAFRWRRCGPVPERPGPQESWGCLEEKGNWCSRVESSSWFLWLRIITRNVNEHLLCARCCARALPMLAFPVLAGAFQREETEAGSRRVARPVSPWMAAGAGVLPGRLAGAVLDGKWESSWEAAGEGE